MKENTAMQEIIEFLENKIESMPDDMVPSARGLYDGYLNSLNKATELLQKEKQQHLSTYNQGYRDGEKDSATNNKFGDDVADFEDAEKYFTTKYNQP